MAGEVMKTCVPIPLQRVCIHMCVSESTWLPFSSTFSGDRIGFLPQHPDPLHLLRMTRVPFCMVPNTNIHTLDSQHIQMNKVEVPEPSSHPIPSHPSPSHPNRHPPTMMRYTTSDPRVWITVKLWMRYRPGRPKGCAMRSP